MRSGPTHLPARSRRRGSHASRLAVAGIVILALSACTHSPSAPPTHRVDGFFAVHGDYSKSPGGTPRTGAPCNAADVGYGDISRGTAVTVSTGGGRLLARTSLGAGRYVIRAGFRDDCVYRFAVTVADRPTYEFEVGRRGGVRFTRSDLARAHWRAELTIGNYTLGT